MNILLVLLCLAITLPAFGQPDYSLQHFTAENGLPQNSVKGISADSEGFIWLATEDGLTRFDGRRFSVYNSSGLGVKSNRIKSIQLFKKSSGYQSTTHKGTMGGRWAAERTEIAYARFESGEGAKIQDGNVILDSLAYVRHIRRLQSLQIGKTVSRDFTYMVTVPDLLFSGAFGNDHHVIMAGGGDGNFFLVTKRLVRYYENWTEQYSCESPGQLLWNYFSIGKRLYYRHNESSISQIYNNSLSKFDVSGPWNQSASKTRSKHRFFWNGSSEQAFIYHDNNLYILQQGKQGHLFTKLLAKGVDLVKLGIEVIFYDSQSERILLGSRISGLYVLGIKQFRTLTVGSPGLTDVFYAQIPYQRNTVLTPTGLVIGFDPTTNRMKVDSLPSIYNVNPLEKRAIISGKDSTIWFKGWNELFKVDKATSKVTKQLIAESDIKALCTSFDGQLWFGTERHGVYKFDPVSGAAQIVKGDIGLVTYLEARSRSEILVGTDRGLWIVNIIKGQSRLISGSEGIYIKSIHVFGNGRAWLTGLRKGLMMLNLQDRLTIFPLDGNMYMASPHCAMDDGFGFMWVPTNKGLFQIKKADLEHYEKQQSSKRDQQKDLESDSNPELFYLYHSMEEGFLTNEFNGSCQPCGTRLPNGFVSLPSLKGLVWFKASELMPYVPNASLILDKLEIDHQIVKVDSDAIAIPKGVETIKFYFSTPYWGHINNLNLSFAIIRKGKPINAAQWVKLDPGELDIQISARRSGDYTLLIRKQSGFGVDNYTVKTVALIFPEEWYENIWYILLISLILILGVVYLTHLLNRHRLRRVIIKNLELRELVSDRTAKLNDTLIGLESSRKDLQRQIYLLSRLLASISHDIKSPLKYISIASSRFTDLIIANELTEAVRVGAMITSSSEQINRMVDQALDFIKIQIVGSNGTHFEDVDVYKLVEEKLILFTEKIRKNGNNFQNQIAEGQIAHTNKQLLSIIVQNLLDNATKYTWNGHISVSFKVIDAQIQEITISNSTSGLPDQILAIFNSEEGEKSLADLIESGRVKGIGLLIVKEVAALINASVSISQTSQANFHLRFSATSMQDAYSTVDTA